MASSFENKPIIFAHLFFKTAMATGLETYDAVRQAMLNRCGTNRNFAISRLDAFDLLKLTSQDLSSRGYGDAVADEVSDALCNRNLDKLAATIGINFDIQDDFPSLVGN
jgi:hypothetical protein